jgi:hypothetical protein
VLIADMLENKTGLFFPRASDDIDYLGNIWMAKLLLNEIFPLDLFWLDG